MSVLLISTYDLGHQPFGLGSAAAALGADGIDARCLDLSRQRLDEHLIADSDVVAFFLPMHTATRLAVPVIDRVRQLKPGARLCAFGLYAPLNAALLRAHGVEHVLGGEFEDDLVRVVRSGSDPPAPMAVPGGPVPRVTFRTPIRAALPALSQYAALRLGEARLVAGYTEASRGCKHRCRHCPVVPVYDGRFRIVPVDVVLEDIRAQVAAGARHVTFGDPDFFNGPGHAREVMRRFAREFPGITYDVTIKVEHLLAERELMPLLRDTGCRFVTSAVESIQDDVLARLEKGHTRGDFERVAELCRDAGLTLVPTFVAFTPWTTLASYCELLQAIDALDLVDHVPPVQLMLRLLIPEGSRLLELDEIRARVGPYSTSSLTYSWRHADPRVDALQRRLEALVGRRLTADRRALFEQVWREAHAAAGLTAHAPREPLVARSAVPYLEEPWYC